LIVGRSFVVARLSRRSGVEPRRQHRRQFGPRASTAIRKPVGAVGGAEIAAPSATQRGRGARERFHIGSGPARGGTSTAARGPRHPASAGS
jgi:hypothetical protein